jgi:hypothetical protein
VFKSAAGPELDGLALHNFDAPENTDPLVYWNQKQLSNPESKLAVPAKSVFSAQAPSVASERVFSTGKPFVPEIRNRLKIEALEASVCLQSWCKLDIDFEVL